MDFVTYPLDASWTVLMQHLLTLSEADCSAQHGLKWPQHGPSFMHIELDCRVEAGPSDMLLSCLLHLES